MRQPQWTKYEAAILLDGYLEVAEKRLPRLQVIRRISSDLRKMANNNGMAIDDIYRNENGISYQIQSMDSAFVRHTVYVPATKLFSEIVELYRANRQEYERLLMDARNMIEPSRQPCLSNYSKDVLAAAENVLLGSFVNGMRKNAAIAQKKFTKAYFELTDTELPEQIDVNDLAANVGYEYSDKIYAISEENKLYIHRLICTAFISGNHVIFYDEMYKQNISFMTQAGIFSSDLLKIILKHTLPKFHYKRSFFSQKSTDTLDKDIAACYEGRLLLSYDEMKRKLPYADMSQIRLICSRSSKFVWAKDETYALADKLHLSESDISESKRIIAEDINKQGFSVFQRITATASVDLNPTVPEAALKEAIYWLHISTDYERKHSIITLPGASFSPSAVMDEYCNGLSEAMLSELYEYEEELTSKTSYSLSAAYSTMIRVDKEIFLSKDSLLLNVGAIDSVLELFVLGEIIPLKNVNSFTSFPEIEGYPWNLYLLDSYCKHFSARFHSMGGPAKSKPVGAIFPAQMQFNSYDDLLAHAAAKSSISLNADDVSAFFTDNAYTLRKIDVNNIIAKAQELRLQEE